MKTNGKYEINEMGTVMWTKDGAQQLANWSAGIIEQRIVHDGERTKTVLIIRGQMNGEPLPDAMVSAKEWGTMEWVADNWGMAPIIFPLPSAERHMRTAIQANSLAETTHVYTATGWSDLEGKRAYLHAGGAITKGGLKKDVNVQLPHELRHMRFDAPEKSRDNFTTSLSLTRVCPKVMTPLLIACYRAAIGPVDFAMHLTGRTGTFKTEVSTLAQQHFGAAHNSRNLPASWSSTPNAIELLAYRAKNAVMVLDDFVPQGAGWQIRQMHAAADKVIRGQGNQAGRSRMNADSTLQETYYPRGMILSTGEETPEGHSVRARMLIAELTPGDVDKNNLTEAQRHAHAYQGAMADWIHWLAQNDIRSDFKGLRDSLRDQHKDLGHSRTPGMLADLLATVEFMTIWAGKNHRGYITAQQGQRIVAKATESLLALAEGQHEYLKGADPAEAFIDAVRACISTSGGHLKSRNGGIPEMPIPCGWSQVVSDGELPSYKSTGARVGWIDLRKNELYIDPGTIGALKKHAGGRLTLGNTTLLKRLKDAGKLERVDAARTRNTVRVTLEGHPRHVIVLNARDTLELNEGE